MAAQEGTFCVAVGNTCSKINRVGLLELKDIHCMRVTRCVSGLCQVPAWRFVGRQRSKVV